MNEREKRESGYQMWGGERKNIPLGWLTTTRISESACHFYKQVRERESSLTIQKQTDYDYRPGMDWKVANWRTTIPKESTIVSYKRGESSRWDDSIPRMEWNEPTLLNAAGPWSACYFSFDAFNSICFHLSSLQLSLLGSLENCEFSSAENQIQQVESGTRGKSPLFSGLCHQPTCYRGEKKRPCQNIHPCRKSWIYFHDESRQPGRLVIIFQRNDRDDGIGMGFMHACQLLDWDEWKLEFDEILRKDIKYLCHISSGVPNLLLLIKCF